jgi:integrase
MGFMRRFYLHKRGGIFYAELLTTAGVKLNARSTGKRTRDEALLVVAEWLKDGLPVVKQPGYPAEAGSAKFKPISVVADRAGILSAIKKAVLERDDAFAIVAALKAKGLIDFPVVPTGKGNVKFIDYLKEFWDYEKSPYVRDKLAHGHSIGRHHCMLNHGRVVNYWEPFFKDRTLNSITRQDIKTFSLGLSETGRSPSTINGIMVLGTSALSYAAQEGYIPLDPCKGIARFSGKPAKRGILTEKEAGALFTLEWAEKRAYLANKVAATTGMRAGEILALRREDIGEQSLHIRHSFSRLDGLKPPKNGDERQAPLYPEIRVELLALADEAETLHGKGAYIFYSLTNDKPCQDDLILDGLHDAIEKLNDKLKKEDREQEQIDWKERNIVFHSWRHYWAARMSDRMTAEQLTRITGHKSRAVFDQYADHITEDNIKEVSNVGREVFGGILRFPEQKGA